MAVQREQVIRSAEKLVSKGRIEAAIREYRKVLSDHPEDANTLNRLGDLYARIQRFDEAVQLFEQIAEAYTQDGFFVKAIAIYKKIIKLDPTRLEIYERLAELYHKQGLVNEARTQYQVLADYHLKHGRSAPAAEIYRKMVDLEPDNPSHHVKLAEIYTEQKLTDKAMAEYATIAELMIGHGHPDQATQVYIRALAIDASHIGFITDAVMKLKEVGRIAEAVRFLAAAVDKNPEARSVARLVGVEKEPTGEAPAASPAPPKPETVPVELEGETVATETEQAPHRHLEPPAPEATTATELTTPMAEPPAVDQIPADEISLEAVSGQAGEVSDVVEGEIELDLEEVFVLDLDDDEPPASQVPPPPDMLDGRPARAFIEDEPFAEVEPPIEPQGPSAAVPHYEPEAVEATVTESAESGPPAEIGLEIDADFLERTAAELQPPGAPSESELVSEAEVLAKYGLTDKAIERLEEALEINPHHLEAYDHLITIQLAQKRHQRVADLAQQMARVAAQGGGLERWRRICDGLQAAGYRVDGDHVSPPASRPRRSEVEGQVDQILQELMGGARPRKKPARRSPEAAHLPEPEAAAVEPSPEAPAAPLLEAEAEPEVGEEPAASLAGLESPDDFTLHGIFDEVKVSDGLSAAASTPSTARAGAGGEERSAGAVPGDDGSSWLDAVGERGAATAETSLFEGEEDFFDLAGELEQELVEEESLDEGEPLIHTREQSLEEIVEGFKKGVAENLSPEDYATHFNLGIAYREMGLLDEAIGEFQLAAKDRAHLVECCSMLGLSFLEKGLPELAIKWYRQGLAAGDLEEEEALCLLYDLGNIYLAMEDREAAYRTFVDAYGINSNYRDLVAKLEELRSVS